MEIKITVKENRQMICSGYIIGTIGENNVTTLSFSFPKEIESWQHFLIADVKGDSYVLPIENETLLLPAYVLTASCFKAQVVATKDSGEKWISSPCRFILFPRINDSGENVVEKAKSEQRETDRTELAGVVTELTGEDYSTSDWDELMDVTAELPVKTEQDIVDLTGCSELTNAFRQATTAPSLLTGGYSLDKDESDEDILIKLPYLYTPNAKYSDKTPISNSVVECGFDVSASGDTLCRYNELSMFNYGKGAQNLRRLKLTGFECIAYGQAMFCQGPQNLIELTIIEGNNYRDEYSSAYYQTFFRGCRKLEAILGSPLDMSRGMTYNGMFVLCESLRHVRFKPGTICHDLDLSYCPALIKKYEATTDDPGTLLSIINGVRDYTGEEEPITVKFSTFVKSYLSSWRCTIDEQTGLYVYSDRNSDNTMWTVLTTVKGVVIS